MSKFKFSGAGKGAAICACAVALALASQISAAGGKGPRASIASSTQCKVVDGALVVTTTATNQSSGGKSAEVRSPTSITGTTKPANQRGNVTADLATVSDIDLKGIDSLPAAVKSELGFSATFDLCNGKGGVINKVAESRELSGKATVSYGLLDEGGETRDVMNRCTDDPETLQNEGGIKTADVIGDIEAFCSNVYY
ncbi:MAG: hypothetical protein OEQ39_16350 [Gammaproteobacteria bacterium]|nr:hypothetical protein [Gammaproteobacteria bacterium]